MSELSIPFTLATLRAMATPNSFDRGKDYYEEGSVRNLVYTGKGFEASVLGSYVYRVKIGGTPSAPKFHCTCPYEYGGICKHCVAAGLAILDKKLNTITVEYEDAEVIDEAMDIHFDRWFAQVPDEDKVRFLQQLLEKDHALKSQFLRFAGADTTDLSPQETSASPDATIDRIREEMASELASLCFDDRIFMKKIFRMTLMINQC